jgi:hypothetical protein
MHGTHHVAQRLTKTTLPRQCFRSSLNSRALIGSTVFGLTNSGRKVVAFDPFPPEESDCARPDLALLRASASKTVTTPSNTVDDFIPPIIITLAYFFAFVAEIVCSMIRSFCCHAK